MLSVISRSIIANISHNPKRLKKSFCVELVLGTFIQSVSSWRFSLITLMLINMGVFLLILLIMPETSRSLKYKINYKTTLDKYLYYFKNR